MKNKPTMPRRTSVSFLEEFHRDPEEIEAQEARKARRRRSRRLPNTPEEEEAMYLQRMMEEKP